jgi:hypothetical protein
LVPKPDRERGGSVPFNLKWKVEINSKAEADF